MPQALGRAALAAARDAAIFLWRSGALHSAMNVLRRRIRQVLTTRTSSQTTSIFHLQRSRRLYTGLTQRLSNHQRNQFCNTAPAPRGHRTPLLAVWRAVGAEHLVFPPRDHGPLSAVKRRNGPGARRSRSTKAARVPARTLDYPHNNRGADR